MSVGQWCKVCQQKERDVPVFEPKRRGGRVAGLSSLRRLPNDGNNAFFQFAFAITDDSTLTEKQPVRIVG